jgi:hypothetical protein
MTRITRNSPTRPGEQLHTSIQTLINTAHNRDSLATCIRGVVETSQQHV